MANDSNLIAELRSTVQARIKEEDPKFHPTDVARLDDDAYLKRFLLHHENVVKDAADMVWESFTWRKSIGANDLNENNINLDYVKEGIFFPNGRDIDGRLILVFKCKMHTKGTKDFDELKKCIVYWFDRIERMEKGQLITYFFDMEGCGLSNMDMELTKYLISLMKLYYPFMLNYIIIFEMPWVLSAAFKIIKQLLPAKAVSKMKFLNRANLKDYVPPEEALVVWGGKNDYKFTFVPENRENASPDHTPKKVTFAEQGDGQHSPGEMLKINPNDTIVFKHDGDELSGQFTITNMDESAVSFKIRTNSPEKFRVRPSSGTLAKGASQTVTIVVQTSFQPRTLQKDRFLILCLQIPKTTLSPTEIADFWQKSSGSKVDEYRLKCNFPEKDSPKNGNVPYGINDSDNQINTLSATLKDLQKSVNNVKDEVATVKILLFVVLFLLFVSVSLGVLLYRNASSSQGVDGQCDRL